MLDRELLNRLQEEQIKLDDFIIEKKKITDSETPEARLRLKIALLAETEETDSYVVRQLSKDSWNELLEDFFRVVCIMELKTCKCDDCEERQSIIDDYYRWLKLFERIAFKLGLETKKEIEKVYMDKNKEN
ncbi:10381_t:CDS:2 [Funneliformis geosporum]|nr:10381_t:CDS:2 [Funneliformis geosporum]